MKKFTVLVALALLAATGTSYAVTCSYDNVPGATLLVPYFKVGREGATTSDIPAGGVDTMVAITNVSTWGVVAHVTVWNKQSMAVLDFNVPMTGYDVAVFRMKDILNGNLNVNVNTQKALKIDPCQDPANIGTAQTDFLRFANPDANDAFNSIGFYATPAFGGAFRTRVWDSLDESYDYAGLIDSPGNDNDNPACGVATKAGYAGDFTGYLTIDVTNYCTNFFPYESAFYLNDAIATVGWNGNGGPNVLMGDVFFIDGAASGGNISGDVAVALEFDSRLDWTTEKTFYARYTQKSPSGPIADALGGLAPAAFQFIGDGREPLGVTYGFRYMNDSASSSQTFLTVWRSDLWDNLKDGVGTTSYNLCSLAYNTQPVAIRTWDEDENENTPQGGGPSGDVPPAIDPFVWWESQRITVAGNSDLNPAGYKFGWTRISFPEHVDTRYNQAFVGVMHTSAGQFVSVGHAATLLDNQFTCPLGQVFADPGNYPYGTAQ